MAKQTSSNKFVCNIFSARPTISLFITRNGQESSSKWLIMQAICWLLQIERNSWMEHNKSCFFFMLIRYFLTWNKINEEHTFERMLGVLFSLCVMPVLTIAQKISWIDGLCGSQQQAKTCIHSRGDWRVWVNNETLFWHDNKLFSLQATCIGVCWRCFQQWKVANKATMQQHINQLETIVAFSFVTKNW